jgi:hypothetical protein
MSPKFGFYINAGFAVLNLSLALFTPWDWASAFNLGVGCFCAYGAYTLRAYA